MPYRSQLKSNLRRISHTGWPQSVEELIKFLRSWDHRSRSGSDDYRHLVNFIPSKPLNGFRPYLLHSGDDVVTFKVIESKVKVKLRNFG